MIKYNLKCKNKHEFESWFLDSREYEKLLKRKMLECIYCGSKDIEKSIMSPRVINSNSKLDINNTKNSDILKIKNDLNKLRNYVEKNFEFVGDKFATKVREVYYDEKNKKNIYGTTTPEEKKELEEEGIDLMSIPWFDKEN